MLRGGRCGGGAGVAVWEAGEGESYFFAEPRTRAQEGMARAAPMKGAVR